MAPVIYTSPSSVAARVSSARCWGEAWRLPSAIEELGVTLKSVAIAAAARGVRKLAANGKAKLSDFPLLIHIDELINKGAKLAIPWESFE